MAKQHRQQREGRPVAGIRLRLRHQPNGTGTQCAQPWPRLHPPMHARARTSVQHAHGPQARACARTRAAPLLETRWRFHGGCLCAGGSPVAEFIAQQTRLAGRRQHATRNDGRCATRIGKQTTCKMQDATCSTQRTTCSSDAPWSAAAPSDCLPQDPRAARCLERAQPHLRPSLRLRMPHAARLGEPTRQSPLRACGCVRLRVRASARQWQTERVGGGQGLLHAAHCMLHVAHCMFHVAHCMLHVAHCILHVVGGAGAEAPACARPSWISTTASHRGPPAHVTTQPVGHHPPSRAPTASPRKHKQTHKPTDANTTTQRQRTNARGGS